VSASVTPGRHGAGSTVRGRRFVGDVVDGSAASGGDVGGADDVAVSEQTAVWQVKARPRGLGTRWWQRGQVEEVPRSSTRTTVIPARVALSVRAPVRWVRRQVVLTRRF
jgi:hypothetical protein